MRAFVPGGLGFTGAALTPGSVSAITPFTTDFAGCRAIASAVSEA